MNNDEYRSIMQILNNKQYELCSHVMDQLQKNCEQMFIFIGAEQELVRLFWVVLCVKQLKGFTENKQGLLIIMNTF